MQNKVCFTVLGEPVGKGRPRFRRVGNFTHTYSPEKTVNYENLVRLAYQEQCGDVMFPEDAALGMRITAYLSIPKSASKRKRAMIAEGTLRPGKKPDWDNLGKSVCDALNTVAFHDDAQIVEGTVAKHYAQPNPRVEVEIWSVASRG